MSDIAKSFASLVKSNNGLFKSEKQAAFLLSQCQEGHVFSTGGFIYNNPFRMFYHCSAKGVVKVEKYTATTGKTVTLWEPKQEGVMSQAEAKKLKFYEREIKAIKAMLEKRQKAFDNGEYNDYAGLFERSMTSDLERLEGFEVVKTELLNSI
jgi:predicted lipid-binding transport protein (Tim44 family)